VITTALPPVLPLVSPILGVPFAARSYDPATALSCYGLLRYLYRQHWPQAPLGDHAATDLPAAHLFDEVWYRGDAPQALETVVAPWDVLVIAVSHPPEQLSRNPFADSGKRHLALVVDAIQLVHSRQNIGVCLEPIRRWRPKVVQVMRPRFELFGEQV